MTEQERMKQGYVWQDDDENMNLQAHTKALVREFNSMPPEDMEGREALLHDIFGKVGKNVWITPPLTAAVGKYVSIGDGTYSNMNLTLIDDWKITIGKNVLIGPNVTLCTTGHPIDPEHRGDGMYSFPITIGDNVWLGANVVVLPDVTIGENSSIWYNVVIRGDMNSIVIGEYTNIQDNSTIHVMGGEPTIIGDYVTIGHNVVLHCDNVGNNCLIRMGVILAGMCSVGENSMIGAGTLVPHNTKLPPNSLILGVPCRIKRKLYEDERKGSFQHWYNCFRRTFCNVSVHCL